MSDSLAVRDDVLWKYRVVSRVSGPMEVRTGTQCDVSAHLEILLHHVQ